MGYLGYVYVESKSFEVRSNVRGGVRLEERSRGLSRSVIMAWPSIFWLLAAWDSLIPLEKTREKWRSFRFGSIVYVLVRRTNKFGNFLELSEYGENGRRSFVIIPEGEEGKGWIDCREQLSKLKQHHDKQKMGEPLTGGRAGKIVAGATGLIKGQREISTANTSLQGAHKSYAEVLQGKGQNLNLNPKQDSNFELESQAIGKPLKDVLSGDIEQAEKITGEQVDFLTFRDLLSDFKRDLIQCIESYMAGWTPPNAEANRARKGVSNGRPKLSMEKPKVQYTYFRKIKQRPKTRWQKVVRPSPPPEAGPGLLQASQGSHAERFLEKGECSRAGSKPDPAPSSPAGILQDRVLTEIAQCSVPECDEELRPRIKEKGGSSRAGLNKVSPVRVLDTPATGDSDTPAAGDNISFGLSSSDRPLHDRSLLAIASGSVSVCSDAIPELPASGSSSPRPLHDRSLLAIASGSVSVCSDAIPELPASGSSSPAKSLHDRLFPSLANGSNCSEQCSDVPAPSLLSSPDLDAAPVICQDHTRGSLMSPVTCHDRTIVQVNVPGFSFSSVCPPVLSEVPVCGHELQIMPGCDLGQLWEAPARATPIPGAPVIPLSSNFSGGPVLSGMDSAKGFTGFGGGEPLCVLRSESFGKEEGQCSDLIVSHDGEEEGQLQFPFTVNESEFPDWVVKVAERIHSKVGVTYVGQKWEFMALLTFLEKEHFKELESQSLSANKMNREVKNLECSINYDNRGDGQSSRDKRKGRGSNVVS
jgi:hypothetical protein